ncbi:MAG: hypothetical protein JSS86_19155 [Cyanobacteria bacterium SZAS LIN-2]|nr:hypothetical protein [Cyanobacteria bacterium SZAS LIN-3]MBS1998455.1 hypothetical protein [Cyanobacteria bacterium SZAS LIN-2]MBS2010929.1 hypothetical protein [Cyanobacteria bacterium SZAS TMP-1]
MGASTTPSGKRVLRKTAKGIVKAGYTVADKGSCVLAEAKERVSDIVEEVRSEQKEASNGDGDGADHKALSKSSKKKHKAED